MTGSGALKLRRNIFDKLPSGDLSLTLSEAVLGSKFDKVSFDGEWQFLVLWRHLKATQGWLECNDRRNSIRSSHFDIEYFLYL